MVTACKAGAGVLSQGSPKRRKLEAIMKMRAHKVDFSWWVSGRRKWGVERRGPGRTKEDRRREQLERETQGRHV